MFQGMQRLPWLSIGFLAGSWCRLSLKTRSC